MANTASVVALGATMNLIKALLAAVGIALGSASYLVFLTVVLFSLPLNVLALMRWFNFEWWGALIAATIMGFVPIVGQLGYIILALAGAYFFVEAGFDWRQATHPAPKEFSVSQLSDTDFEKFKVTLSPAIETQCKEDGQRRYAFDGKIPVSVSRFCTCYAQTAVAVFTRADYLYQEAHGDVPDDAADRLKSAVYVRCAS